MSKSNSNDLYNMCQSAFDKSESFKCYVGSSVEGGGGWGGGLIWNTLYKDAFSV